MTCAGIFNSASSTAASPSCVTRPTFVGSNVKRGPMALNTAGDYIAMSKRFTIDGSPALESRLGALCDQLRHEVVHRMPPNTVAAIVLGGGYGRGEGGVLKTATGDAPYNDIEFYVFVRKNRLWHDAFHS